jgi:hypothetical protein
VLALAGELLDNAPAPGLLPHPSRAIVRACSRVASRNGAAGYKVMRLSHEPMDIDAGPAERAPRERGEPLKSRAD